MVKKQKIFSVRFKNPKDLPSIRGRQDVTASSKAIARRKFKRDSVFRGQKITGVTEIK